VKEADSINLYGNKVYSDDSSLCLAAFHAGVITPDGGDFMVKLKKG
jgi:hypothetical protein